MLNVSERAKVVLADAMSEEQAAEDSALRLSKTGEGQFGLVRGAPQESDQVVTKDERPLLYVDNDVASSLDGATLDVVEKDGREHLTLTPPA